MLKTIIGSQLTARTPMTDQDLNKLGSMHEQVTPGPRYVRHLSDALCMSAIAVATTPEDEEYGFSFDWNEKEMVAAACDPGAGI
jgi:hypothetical protein